MSEALTKEQRSPLAYHLASDQYGRGVCGTYGMMASGPGAVTCGRCKRSAKFKATINIASRYAGARA